jgi:hypothetical protein
MSPVPKYCELSKGKYLWSKSEPLKIFRAYTKSMAPKFKKETAKLI